MDTLVSLVVAAVIGFVTGGLGSLVAPWANWGVEKQRQRQERRRKVLEEARNLVAYHDFTPAKFSQDRIYPVLRPYLEPSLVEAIETPNGPAQWGSPDAIKAAFRDHIFRNVARIEKEWKLL